MNTPIRRLTELLSTAAIVFLICAAASADSKKYVVTKLLSNPKSIRGIAALNNNLAVACWGPLQGRMRACVWRDGRLSYLSSIPGVTSIEAVTGINESGLVVGFAGGRAWLWNKGIATPLFAADSNLGLVINNAGHVAGCTADSKKLVLWQNGQSVELGTLPIDGRVMSINDSDQVIVNVDGWNKHSAHVYQSGAVTDLLPPTGRFSPQAYDINKTGEIIGGCSVGPIIWRDGVTVQLPPLFSHSQVDLAKINNHGTVIGDCNGHACVWECDQVYEVEPTDPRYFVHWMVDINDHGVILALVDDDTQSSIPALLSPQIPVSLDVRPGTDTNEVSPGGGGLVPVAVLTTADFDAAAVMPGGVLFGGVSPKTSSLTDVDGDGDLDLLLQFQNSKLKFAAEDYGAELTGWTSEHIAIIGSDRIVVRGVKPAPIRREFRYTCRVLTTLEGYDVEVTDINEAGQIVGVRIPNGGAPSAVLIDPDGTVTDIAVPGGEVGTCAVAINDSSVVAGTSGDDEWSTGSISWAWTDDMGAALFDPIQGLNAGEVSDINNAGTTVGTLAGSNNERAFARSADNDVRFLSLLPQCYASWASAVNSRGCIAGGCYGGNYSGPDLGCYWDENGRPHAIGLPQSRQPITYVPLAVNDQGTVAGYWYRNDSGWTQCAFVWRMGSQPVDLDDSSIDSSARAINNSGIVVGVMGWEPYDDWPFAWTAETGSVLLPFDGHCSATAVNDKGVIAGTGGSDIILWEPIPPTPITIDILPGVSPNTINLRSKGTIQVAIITTLDFDADIVNGAMSTFAGARPTYWDMRDVDADGDKDLLLTFNIRDLKLGTASTSATLTAITKDDREVAGTDAVTVVRR